MASLSVDEMRLAIRDEYKGEGWKYKVMHMMKDNQVIAIYQSIQNRKIRELQRKKEDGHWEQMSIGQYLEGRDNAKSYICNL